MVCKCTNGLCGNCKCGKDKSYCTSECHMNMDFSQTECMNHEIGTKVKTMKIKDLRAAIIASGLSPIGDNGELKKRYSDYLMQNQNQKSEAKAESTNGKSDKSGKSSNSSSAGGNTGDMKALFEAIINNEGDNAFVLSLSGKEVTDLTGKALLRKAYLLLSTKVHPDKNASSKEAVQAFQIVLSAYEYLVNPPEDDDEKPAGKRQKMERYTRPNHGCFKTKIKCPQCKREWGDAVLGLEEGAYNFLMMGIKKYICGLCCCKFGCMTALHYCPHCRKSFEYDSDDFHRKIVCGNERCKTDFGFWMFKVSERREKEVRLEVKKEFEEERKKLAQKKRRAARADKRVVDVNISGNQRLQEQLLIIGLRDTCPRCGWEMTRGLSTDDAKNHLDDCNDQKAIKRYQKEVAKQKEEETLKKNAVESEYEIMALKRWEMNGRQVGQLWMLSEFNIIKQCKLFQLSTEGEKHELIGRLGQYLRSRERLMITDGKTKLLQEVKYDTCGIGQADEEDLPDNIHELDREELQDVCASYNIKFDPKKDAKSNLVKKFVNSRAKGREQYLICDKKDDTSDDDDDDEEYTVGSEEVY